MQKPREHWSNQLGFILAAAGSAIGLGTLWKVPYVIGQNGGGLFVLIYVFCIFFIGIPVFIAELMLGRKTQRAAVGTFVTLSHNSALWKIPGWLGVISAFMIMSFYSVVAGWGLNYIFMCLNQFYSQLSPSEISQVFARLESSGDITLFWNFLFTALTIGLVYPGVREGIEYWSKFMTSSLFVLLVILCSYSITLDGFDEAVRFIFYPDFSNFKVSGALEALGLSFFTLSLGQGVMLTYGSYMRRSEDIPKTSAIIGLSITGASILAGLMIFPIIFTFGFKPQEGPGLVFKTLPLLFGKLPGSLILSVSFFTLFTFAALTSAIALVEVVAANFIDLFGWNRKKAVLITGMGTLVFGIPSALAKTNWLFANWQVIYGKNFFETVDNLVSVWLLSIGGLMIALFTGWKLDKELIKEEFQQGTVFKWLFAPWLFFIRWIVPIAILLIIAHSTELIDIDYWATHTKSLVNSRF
ncbi:putative sodium-dependent transporter YhdH [Chlamydiales bacterium STE3]|nr:putative sodium-dependent transporter YhdH [Chlamydiales bacterium STE3]